MADHAKFSPSKMQRIIACPGSVALEDGVADTRNDYADEGTIAHDLAARVLRGEDKLSGYIGLYAYIDTQGVVVYHPGSGGKHPVTADMAEAVQVYADSVRRKAHGKLLLVEQRVDFSQAADVPEQFGTSDAIIIDLETGEIWIIDLKFGMGVKVYAEGNEQMLTYAVGVLETFAEILPAEITKIHLMISQPRLDHEDVWTCTVADVQKHVAKMREAISKAACGLDMYRDNKIVPDVYFEAGEKQCKFCKAKAFCPTLAASVAEAVTNDFKAFENVENINKVVAGPMPRAPSPELIGARFGLIPLVEMWVEATRAETERMVFAGMDVIGLDGQRMKLVEGKKGNRAWKDEKQAEGVLAGFMPVDKLYKPREIVTPSVAGKFFGERKKSPSPHWADVQKLYHQPPGRPSVVLGSDPRPAWSGEAHDSEFTDVSSDPTT